MNNLRVHLGPIEQFLLHPEQFRTGGLEELRSFFAAYLNKDFGVFTPNGRSALALVLNHLELNRSDEIWITTSFDYPNVSSCVTSTVFNFCKPSRVFSSATRAVLMIHEFGVVHPRRDEILKLCKQQGIPLIEDCAHTFMSRDAGGYRAGEAGDWTIISFPKFYPVRRGGMLLGREEINVQDDLTEAALVDLKNVSGMIAQTDAYGQARREVLQSMITATKHLGLTSPMFDVEGDVVGWFFPVLVPNALFYFESLLARGVDCCIWHGTQIVALPLHQYLTSADLSFMFDALADVNRAWRAQQG
jgi:dTDP-4-amino-4,6-dideoxygalactose transaminase